MSEFMDVPYIVGMWRLLDQPYLKGREDLLAYIKRRIDQGCNLFDHANIYSDGQVESQFGEAMRLDRGLRDHVQIITKADIILKHQDSSDYSVKYYDTSRSYLMGQLDESLKRLSVDQVNLFLIHRPDPLADMHELGNTLDEIVKSGKAAAVGVSNFTQNQWRLLQSCMDAPLIANQIELSMFERSSILDSSLQAMQVDNIRPQAWSPFGGGAQFDHVGMAKLRALAEKLDVTTEALTLAWISYLPASPLSVVGSFNEDRHAACLKASEVKMTRPLWFSILEAFEGQEVP